MKTGLRDDEMARIRAALEAVPAVEKAVLFGSRAMGLARSNSDVDMLLYGDALRTRDVLRVASLLEATTLPYQFDLIRHDANNTALLEHVRKYGKVIFQRQEMSSQSKPIRKESDMGVDWNTARLEDVTSILGDGLHGTPEYEENGEYHFINGNNLSNGKIIITENTKRSGEAEYLKHKKNLNENTILVSINGTIGNAAKYNGEKIILGKSACYFNVKNNIDRTFIFYIISSPIFFDYINSLATGSTIKNVSLKLMRDYSFKLPPIEEQRAIAHILGTLDDKIELNRRMNETLEAMARALFKAWFVDFEPVRAKLDGRWRRGQSLPGLPAHLYDLFPDRLVESELGEIPEGWEIRSMNHVFTIIGGGTPKTSNSEYWEGSIPWFSVVDTPQAGDVFVIETEKKITKAGVENSSARIISKGTTIIFARETVGNIAVAGQDMTFNQSCYGLQGNKDIGDYFVYLMTGEIVEQLNAMSHGSVFSTITRKTLEAIHRTVPSLPALRDFNRIVESWFEQIHKNMKQNNVLVQLRDTLLPKLISGELRVPDVERLLGEH